MRLLAIASVLLAFLVSVATGFSASETALNSNPAAASGEVLAKVTKTPAEYQAAAEAFKSQDITPRMAWRATGILVLFLLVAGAIAFRLLPAMIALPLMALGIGLVAGVPIFGSNGILSTILEGRASPSPTGAFQLYKAIIWVLFGGIFARFISDSKIAERIVKYAAEYGGEDPFLISLLMAAITIVIFTASGGLPMIIMLGTVMFPILLSLGVPAVICGSIMLLSFPIGQCLNPSEWARISEVFRVDSSTTRTYFLSWAGIQTVVLLAFLSYEFLRMKRSATRPAAIIRALATFVAAAILILGIVFLDDAAAYLPAGWQGAVSNVVFVRDLGGKALQLCLWLVLAAGIIISQFRYRIHGERQSAWNLITPVLPLIFLLILGFNDAFIPAFMASLAYGVLTTPEPQALQKLGRCIMNGVGDVAAPVILMVGIGMLIAAATHPAAEGILTPILARVIPTTPIGYVVLFLVASPLSLYRGPLNQFGLGVGVARLMQNFMPPAATMGALQSVGMLQDPTSTQNVWICGFLKLDINALLFKLFIYSLLLVVAGLSLSALLFF